MDDDENRSIFRIMDKILSEVNKTKTIFTILIALIIIPLGIITLTFLVFDITDSDYYFDDFDDEYLEDVDGEYPEDIDGEYPDEFLIQGLYLEDVLSLIIIIVIAVVIGIAIRQLLVLNKWTSKYQKFKDDQDELDKKFDDDLEK